MEAAKVMEDSSDDGFVHIRRHPNAAVMDPALCGRRGQRTTTGAWGYYGPGGAGFDEMCTQCVAIERAPERRRSAGAALVAKAESPAIADPISWGLVQLAALVGARNEVLEKRAEEAGLDEPEHLHWALLVPTDPNDHEWIIRLGEDLEVVADRLDLVLDLALEHLRSYS